MNTVLRVGGKIVQFAWRNRQVIIPIAMEGYRILKRWIKINKLKKAKLNKEL